MRIDLEDGEKQLLLGLQQAGYPDCEFSARTAIWLEACGYPGLQNLSESLADPPQAFSLVRDALGIDLKNLSCARIGHTVVSDVMKNGRAFLRNVRHGLFLLPASVEHKIGIGCPIDPSFALGGERSKNPYVEKLEAAKLNGVEVDEALWHLLTKGS